MTMTDSPEIIELLCPDRKTAPHCNPRLRFDTTIAIAIYIARGFDALASRVAWSNVKQPFAVATVPTQVVRVDFLALHINVEVVLKLEGVTHGIRFNFINR